MYQNISCHVLNTGETQEFASHYHVGPPQCV